MSKNIDISSLAQNLAGLNQAELELALKRLLQKQEPTQTGPTHRKEVNGHDVLSSALVGVRTETVNGVPTLVPCELGSEGQVGRFVAIYGHGFQGDGNGGYRLEHLDNYKFSKFEQQEGTTDRKRTVLQKDMSWAIGGCVLLIDLAFGEGGPAVSAIIPAVIGNARAHAGGLEGFSVSFDQRVAGFRNEDVKPIMEGLIARMWGYSEAPIGDATSLEGAKAAVARINRFGVSADRTATTRQVVGADGKLVTMAAPVSRQTTTTSVGGSGGANMAALAAARQASLAARAARG